MRRLLGLALAMVILAGGLIGAPLMEAQAELDPYVSHPGNIPNLHNFTTPQLAPGEKGAFQLQLTNRYVVPMQEVALLVEIYMRADLEQATPMEQVQHKPRIIEFDGASNVANAQQMRWEYNSLATNASVFPGFNITTTEETDQGTYFVRFRLEFELNGTPRLMLSRGHWNNSQWEEATTDVEEGSPGNLNLTLLGVDGVIPDSSFGVKKPIPRWPLYVLIGLTVFFGGLAVVFYLEEEGTYPGLNKWLKQQRGKLEQLRLLFENRRRHP